MHADRCRDPWVLRALGHQADSLRLDSLGASGRDRGHAGRARIWGTANPRYWANLDPQRPTKKAGLILDLGRLVRPFITPDDPGDVEAIIRARAKLGPAPDDAGRAPII